MAKTALCAWLLPIGISCRIAERRTVHVVHAESARDDGDFYTFSLNSGVRDPVVLIKQSSGYELWGDASDAMKSIQFEVLIVSKGVEQRYRFGRESTANTQWYSSNPGDHSFEFGARLLFEGSENVEMFLWIKDPDSKLRYPLEIEIRTFD